MEHYGVKVTPILSEAKSIDALAALAIHEGTEEAMKRLAEWYETQNHKLFMLSVKKDLTMEGVKESLEAMNESVNKLNVKGLPFVSLDGHEITPTIFWAKVEWDAIRSIDDGEKHVRLREGRTDRKGDIHPQGC